MRKFQKRLKKFYRQQKSLQSKQMSMKFENIADLDEISSTTATTTFNFKHDSNTSTKIVLTIPNALTTIATSKGPVSTIIHNNNNNNKPDIKDNLKYGNDELDFSLSRKKALF